MIRQLLVIILFSLWSSQSWAQVDLFYQLGKDSIFIGDQVELELQLKLAPNVEITSLDFSLWDSIPVLVDVDALLRGDTNPAPRMAGEDFELVDLGLWPDLSANKNILGKDLKWNTIADNNLSNTIKFTFWKEGVFGLPPIIVNYKQGNQEARFANEQGLILTVFSPLFTLNEPVDSLELADVKPILQEAKTLEDYLLYIISAIVFLLAFAIVYFYLNRKSKEEEYIAPPIELSAHEYALEQLKGLDEEKLWQQGEVKAYQSGLTYILRQYLEYRYDIPALESTTDELLRQLKKENFSAMQKDKLREILQVADLVKFAKSKPAVDIHTKVMEDAENFVRETKSDDVRIAIYEDGFITKVREEMEEEEKINPLDLQENLGDLSQRFFANLIDLLFIGLVLYLIIISFGAIFQGEQMSMMSSLLFLALVFFVVFAYMPITESMLGASLGKTVLGLSVRNMNNESISMWQAYERMLMKARSWGLLFSLFSSIRKQDKILKHDKTTGTRIVKKAKI